MKCRELQNWLETWREGKAPAGVESHLKECAQCRAQAEESSRASLWLSFLKQEPPQLSPGFWVRFWEERAVGAGDFWATLAVLGRRASMALLAILLLLSAAVPWFSGSEEPAQAVIEAPQPYWVQVGGTSDGAVNGPDREQVVLTLVARAE